MPDRGRTSCRSRRKLLVARTAAEGVGAGEALRQMASDRVRRYDGPAMMEAVRRRLGPPWSRANCRPSSTGAHERIDHRDVLLDEGIAEDEGLLGGDGPEVCVVRG